MFEEPSFVCTGTDDRRNIKTCFILLLTTRPEIYSNKGHKWFSTSTGLRHGGKSSSIEEEKVLPLSVNNHFNIWWCVPSFLELADIVLAVSSSSTETGSVDENGWQWIPGSDESVLQITIEPHWCCKCYFSHIFSAHTTHLRSDLDLGSVAARKKAVMSFLRFQSSFSVDLWIEALSSWKHHCSPSKYLAKTGHRFASRSRCISYCSCFLPQTPTDRHPGK